MLTASPWITGGDHLDTLVLRGWSLSSKTWNPTNSPWMKQLTWLRIVHFCCAWQKLNASVDQAVKCADVKIEKNAFKVFKMKHISCLILS